MACLICNQKGKLSPVAGHEAIVPSAESLEDLNGMPNLQPERKAQSCSRP